MGGHTVTQAPDREREVAPVRAPERSRGDRAWAKAVMFLNVALIGAVAIVGLTYVQRSDRPSGEVEAATPVRQPGSVASTLPSPEDDLSEVPEAEEVPIETPSAPPAVPPVASGTAARPPKVPVQMRADFSKGDRWPVGAGFRESGAMRWSLTVMDGVMSHGDPRGPNVVSWLEKWTKSDVRTIGARVRFAPNNSGTAALTAWHTSVLEESGQDVPRTGMRLVLAPGSWRLVTIDEQGVSTLAEGTWTQQGRVATVSMVRKADTVWVTAPDGTVTPVTDERVASLSGPWAGWELREGDASKRPAGFLSIWAG